MRIIETTEQLQAFLAELGDAPYVTLDTEFLRDQTYYPRLCLIQMAAPKPGAEAIIDPLAHGLDLDALLRLHKTPAHRQGAACIAAGH